MRDSGLPVAVRSMEGLGVFCDERLAMADGFIGLRAYRYFAAVMNRANDSHHTMTVL